LSVENRERLEEQRKRCEGLAESIVIGLRKLRVDTTIEDHIDRTTEVVSNLSFVEVILRDLDKRVWLCVPDHLKNG
jgi:hypothetical protein